MGPMLPLLLDLAIIVLLAATVVYAMRLNQRLNHLREGRGELERLIKVFSEATARAEAGVQGMRRAASESGETLQKTIEKAIALRDELQFMIEAGDSLAGRLEGLVSQAPGRGSTSLRPGAPAEARPNAPEAAPGAGEAESKAAREAQEVRSSAERELLQALENLR